jgi:chromosomal replication initiation ATPase DnaA
MSETITKHKVSVWSYPGVVGEDSQPGEKVFDSLIAGFDDKKILQAILKEFDVDRDKFFSGRRYWEVLDPMRLYRYLLRSIKGNRKMGNHKPLRYSLREIGEMTGCDHATVLHSCKTSENLIQTDKIYRAKFEAVMSKLPRYVFTLKKLY